MLRSDVKPTDCYIDGRIESLMEDIQQLGMHLRSHEDTVWNKLLKHTVEIFVAEDAAEKEAEGK